MEREEEIQQLLHEIRGVLASHQASSIDSYPANEELKSFFETCRQQASFTPPNIPVQQKEESPAQPVAVTKKSDHTGLAEIATEVNQCRSCALSKDRSVVMPGKGGSAKIRLFIIGHWLPVSGSLNSKSVFGVEEDQMLKRMLAAIQLPMEEVFVTNVIKCSVGPGVQPQAEHIAACASYLKRQIIAASPQLICTMGMVATKALLRLSQPLSRLRGRFYQYQAGEGIEIPLLPTYHPGYLLQNPEMKNATWQDLQALQKRLAS